MEEERPRCGCKFKWEKICENAAPWTHLPLVLYCLIHDVAGRTFPAGERGSAAGSLLSSHCPNYTWACVLPRPSPELPFYFYFVWSLGWSTCLPREGGGGGLHVAGGGGRVTHVERAAEPTRGAAPHHPPPERATPPFETIYEMGHCAFPREPWAALLAPAHSRRHDPREPRRRRRGGPLEWDSWGYKERGRAAPRQLRANIQKKF
jgi:hypothetical protein